MGSRPPAVDNTVCVTCGKSFHVKPSVLAKGKGRYCSKQCVRYVSGPAHPLHGKSRTDGGAERTCAGCGVIFRHRRSQIRYCTAACHHRANPRKPTAWHRKVAKNGYVRLTLPDGERVYEHRYVWSKVHGPIPPRGLIHHRNENTADNAITNLELKIGHAEHAKAHGGSLRHSYPKRIPECHQERRHRAFGMCEACYSRHRRALGKG